jgi:hypothetical protein
VLMEIGLTGQPATGGTHEPIKTEAERLKVP